MDYRNVISQNNFMKKKNSVSERMNKIVLQLKYLVSKYLKLHFDPHLNESKSIASSW